jgi:hypothetical protein
MFQSPLGRSPEIEIAMPKAGSKRRELSVTLRDL